MSSRSNGADWRQVVAPVARSTDQARSTYDRLARWYDVFEAPFEQLPRRLGIDLLQAKPGERVLELGCGTGHTLAALAPQVGAEGRVLGLDLSRKMLRCSRHRLRHHLPADNVTMLQADARRLPLRSASLDAVTMSFTLELMPTDDIPVVLRECRRVLRPAGRIVVVSLALDQPPPLMTRLYLRAHHRWPRLLDCRPLPVRAVVEACGYQAMEERRSAIAGIAVSAVRACPRGDADPTPVSPPRREPS